MARIELYTKDYCPYCVKAKALLDQVGAVYSEIDLSDDPTKLDELRARKPDARTLPQVFIDGKAIGGCDDLYALHESGDLAEMLA